MALCAGNSPVPVNSPHKGQWRGALMFSLICIWINGWVNNREAGDLRRHRGHYGVSVMKVYILVNSFRPSNAYMCQEGSPSLPVQCQAIIWTNARLLLIGTLGTNFNEISIKIYTFSFKKMHLKMSAKWRQFCLDLNMLTCNFVSSHISENHQIQFALTRVLLCENQNIIIQTYQKNDISKYIQSLEHIYE